MATRSILNSTRALRTAIELPPVYLAPSLQTSSAFAPAQQTSQFSTSTSLSVKDTRDNSKKRGVSAIHRTGVKQALSVSKYPLPKPVLDRKEVRSKIETNPDHGLWAFFPETRQAVATPAESGAHGRAWTMEELKLKSWPDLHRLWWVCQLELNRIATTSTERRRLHLGYGEYEEDTRRNEVIKTQKAIRNVLIERWNTWEDARALYHDNPERYFPEGEMFATESELNEAAEVEGAVEELDEKEVKGAKTN